MKVKVVPCEADDAIKDAFYAAQSGRFAEPKPQEYWDAMLSASPDTGYVPVKREDAKEIIRYLRKAAQRSGLKSTMDEANEIADRLRKALEEQ